MRNRHPLAVLTYFAAAALSVALSSDPIIAAVSLVFAFMSAALLGVRRFLPYIGVIFACAVVNALFVHKGVTALFFINNTPVTLEATLGGLDLGVTLAAAMLWLACFNRVTDTEKLLYLFGRFTPRLGITLSMALRFAPLFVKKLREISAAQRAMGMYSSPALPDRVMSRLSVFGATATWAFENGVTTAISMDARGYGHGRRSFYTLFRFKTADAAIIGLTAVLAGIMLVLSGELYFAFYPRLTPLNAAVLPRLAHVALCIIPIVTEITEKIKWKYSALKISALPTAEPRLPF